MAASLSLRSMLGHTLNSEVLNFWAGKFNPLWSVDQPLAKIVARKQAASGSVTLTLKPNRHVIRPAAGQHVSVTADIEGVRVTRSYSPQQVPGQPDLLAITVKQVPGGRLSNWLCLQAKVGHVLHLGLPFGELNMSQQPVILLAAGSGITPMQSLLQQYAAQTSPQPVQLHYWVSQREHACFIDELLALQKQQPNFSFYLYLTGQPANQPDERSGRITASQFADQKNLANCQVLACGPAGFVDSAQQILQSQVASFQAEAFSLPELVSSEADATVQITLQKQQRVIEVPAGQSILTALEAQGINHPSGCRMGICNTCACGKVSGSTRHMVSGDEQHTADPALRICISSARSDLILDI